MTRNAQFALSASPMADRFSAFSFVDRIATIEPSVCARGHFTIPATLRDFSPCLVAEAVAQLAAWVAMEHTGFTRRPIAALAAETRVVGLAAPGDEVELSISINSVDHDTVAVCGSAEIGGKTVLELEHCVGPMLPLEEFDAPELIRERFELLIGLGAPPCRFPGVAEPALVVTERDSGARLRAVLRVPAEAPFFGDHFPRQPVFPGSLLLAAQIRLAIALAGTGKSHDAVLRPERVEDVKLRTFIPPGAIVEIEATRLSETSRSAKIGLSAMLDGKRVGTARVVIGHANIGAPVGTAEAAP